jgi:cytochrome c oxidase assembly factor CtaG
VILLADTLPPPLSWSQLGAVQVDAATWIVLAAAVLYGLGWWRLRARGVRWSTARVAAFAGGLAVTWFAVNGVVGVYDDVLFYDHMIQHLLLVMVAAPLLALGTPIELLERSSSGRLHRAVTWALRSKLAHLVAHPVVDFAAYAVLIPVAHLTAFYNLTLTNDPVHDLEHLLFLVVGYLFWRQVIALEPARIVLHPGVRFLYLVAAVPVDTFTGLALASASHEPFLAYLSMHRTWGPSLIADIHMGGAIMWIGGDSLMMAAVVPLAVAWVRHEEARQAELDEILDADGEAELMPGPASVPDAGSVVPLRGHVDARRVQHATVQHTTDQQARDQQATDQQARDQHTTDQQARDQQATDQATGGKTS